MPSAPVPPIDSWAVRAVCPHEQRLRDLAAGCLAARADAPDAPRATLLSGPAGCGKTRLARLVAACLNVDFRAVRGMEIRSRSAAEGGALLEAAFTSAAAAAPSLLFVEDVDLLAPYHALEPSADSVHPAGQLAAQLAVQLDRLRESGGVFFVGATTRPGAVAPELRFRGRLDREIVVPVPDRRTRRAILAEHAVRCNSSAALDLEALDLEALARITSGFTAADLETVSEEAALAARRRSPESPRLSTEDYFASLSLVGPSAAGQIFLESPHTRWADVGGMDEPIRRLRELVEWPLRNPELYARAGVPRSRGVLLQGPAGSGKTLLARALANESGAGFIAIRGDLLGIEHPDPASALREAFRRARQAAPCILFLDNLDELLGDSAPGAAPGQCRLACLLRAEMRSPANQRGVAVLAAVHHTGRLDPSLLGPGCFEDVVVLPFPDEDGRREILALHLAGRCSAVAADLDHLARETEGLTGADLRSLCDRASQSAACRAMASGAEPHFSLEAEDFDQALEDVRQRRQRHFT